MANISIHDLSITISELVNLDLEQQSSIESALNRAISAKEIVGGSDIGLIAGGITSPKPVIAGGIFVDPILF